MVIYMDLVVILNFFVDFLLLLGTNRLAGYPPGCRRALIAAALGAVYAGACMLPGFSFLGNTLWRAVSLLIMGAIAFGFHKNALRRCILFFFLSMALGGIAMGLGQQNIPSLILAAGGVAALCFFGFRGKLGKTFVPVELTYGENRVKLNALRDTGNSLRDPLTGQEILIISPRAASRLTGLTSDQLKDPAGSLGALPGLRLVPYRAVGQAGGMLLAIRLQEVKVGARQGAQLVAFAPEGLGNGEYEALTGGAV
ncbi:MAG: sigma-E processing peptidase SpoIIGA [Lentisphaeria bacterium]|nr:sigma-E processing peptidase SpoIIGA [Lentisphaeria bacterium]